ncbi:MAG: hypothetical protein LBO21_08680, partial [Synergistaceae bacterium]|nr:hypothetical protein [Synergistaceae bacterium]
MIRALHSAEKRHMALRKSASDNDDRETIKHESMTIPRIIKWKDALEALRADILPSGAVSREDVGAVFPTARATTGHPDFTPEHELSRPIDMFPITSYMNPKGISGRDAKRGESYIGKKPTALE